MPRNLSGNLPQKQTSMTGLDAMEPKNPLVSETCGCSAETAGEKTEDGSLGTWVPPQTWG